jgi:hypothetical protein
MPNGPRRSHHPGPDILKGASTQVPSGARRLAPSLLLCAHSRPRCLGRSNISSSPPCVSSYMHTRHDPPPALSSTSCHGRAWPMSPACTSVEMKLGRVCCAHGGYVHILTSTTSARLSPIVIHIARPCSLSLPPPLSRPAPSWRRVPRAPRLPHRVRPPRSQAVDDDGRPAMMFFGAGSG